MDFNLIEILKEGDLAFLSFDVVIIFKLFLIVICEWGWVGSQTCLGWPLFFVSNIITNLLSIFVVNIVGYFTVIK